MAARGGHPGQHDGQGQAALDGRVEPGMAEEEIGPRGLSSRAAPRRRARSASNKRIAARARGTTSRPGAGRRPSSIGQAFRATGRGPSPSSNELNCRPFTADCSPSGACPENHGRSATSAAAVIAPKARTEQNDKIGRMIVTLALPLAETSVFSPGLCPGG